MDQLPATKNKVVLKPCPFCGGEATLEAVPGHFDGWSVGCSDEEGNCYGYQSLQTFARQSEAIEAWNKRAFECTCINAKKIEIIS